MKSEITTNNDSTVTIKAALTADAFASFRAKALKHLGEHANIPGFRKGAIPEGILEQRLGEGPILTQMAEIALDHHYPDILKEHNLAAIGQPQITITKLAAGNPFEVTITTAILPTIDAGDYKKMAKDIFSKPFTPEITEEAADKTILEIRKQLYRQEHPVVPEDIKEGEVPEEPKESELPIIDDAQAQKMGAKDFAHFREELKKRMAIEEELKERDRRINTLIDSLVDTAKLTLPALVIEAELSRMMAEMRANIEQIGIPFDQYLTHIKKTEEDLRLENLEAAKKRGASHLILKHIAAAEHIEVDESELANEVARLKKMYPTTNTDRISAYVRDYMENQAVIVYLEQSGKGSTTPSTPNE